MQHTHQDHLVHARTSMDVEELRSLLEQGTAVTVLDIRPAAQFQEWSIPGSVHVDAYEALKNGDPGPLSDAALPTDRPVVTVCAMGRTSRAAAEYLRERGIDALTLEGGMSAWSLAWNTAEVPLPDDSGTVVQLRRTGKGCLSYVVGSEGEAAVVDASIPAEVYEKLAHERGWTIAHVLDTHVHADHISRSRQLAEATGAMHYLPDPDRVSFDVQPIRHGDTLRIGRLTLQAIHTPGHTPESMCYLLDQPALFTGDTLFLDGVGRPDLEAGPEEAQRRASALYRSLKRLQAVVPPAALVLPGHTSRPVPFDRTAVADTLDAVRARVAALRLPEAEFVAYLLSRIPPAPPNHAAIVRLNEAGAMPGADVLTLEAGANRCAIQ